MIYTAKVVPYKEGMSKLSYDHTPLICGNDGCTNHVNQLLTVPGEQIGRPGQMYRVIRCYNCIFWGPYYVYFNEGGQPLRVVFDQGENANFIYQQGDTQNPASLLWSAELPDPKFYGWVTTAGGEPIWLQEAEEAICSECHSPMEFILQLSSMTMDGYRDESGRPTNDGDRFPKDFGYPFGMTLEYYATLYLFACGPCRITCSITQCT